MAWRDSVLDSKRAAALLDTLIRFGTAVLFEHIRKRAFRRATLAHRLRRALEHLGLTYVKLGQFLALRFDLLPADVCRELESLFENVRAEPFERIRSVVESELGAPIAVLFAAFGDSPLASASIAQVHEAVLADGTRVAVKVQRPGIARLFAADMRILRRAAAIADSLRLFRAVSLVEAVDQFWIYTSQELDFVGEGRAADRLRANRTSREVIPRVYWEFTTPRLLTLEFVDGVSIGALIGAYVSGGLPAVRERLPRIALEQVLHNLAFASLHQLFVTGFFHGDPHPGNILVLDDNRVAFVDFGIYGELTARDRELLRSFLEYLALGDFERSFHSYSRLFDTTERTDFAAFKRETMRLMQSWFRLSRDPRNPAEHRLAARFSDEMSLLVRKNYLRMSMETLLFWRVLVILDATALRFSAHFDLLRELRSFFQQERIADLARALSPASTAERAALLAGFTTEAPGQASRLISTLFHERQATSGVEVHMRPSTRGQGIAGAVVTVAAAIGIAALPLPGWSIAALCLVCVLPAVAVAWRSRH